MLESVHDSMPGLQRSTISDVNGVTQETCQAEPAIAIQSLLTSSSFRKAPTLRRLLEYLWKHRDSAVSEYAVATEILNRKPDFDPKIDSVVRVHILRLRQKLKEYYEKEGIQDSVRFTIPVGSLSIRAEHVVPVENSLHTPPSLTAAGEKFSKRDRLWAALVVLFAIVAALGWHKAINNKPQLSPELPPFWTRSIGNGKPTRLVIPSPVFVRWNNNNLRVRDFRVNEFDKLSESPEMRVLIEKWGPPTLSQSYSVMPSSLAAASLSQYLAVRGVPVGVAPEGQLALNSFGNENLVFLGIPHTSKWLNELLPARHFRLDPSGRTITNLQPERGEPRQFNPTARSSTRSIEPHLLALLPGKVKGTNLLLLGGTSGALALFLTSPSGLDIMEGVWKQHQRPRHFEVVVTAETEGTALVKASIAAFRTVPESN